MKRFNWGENNFLIYMFIGCYFLEFLFILPNFLCFQLPHVVTNGNSESSSNSSLSTQHYICWSQFQLSFKSCTHVSKKFLESAQELLKLLSYLALDLNVTDNKTYEVMHNDQLISTFNTSDLYKINFFGYCKKNKNTNYIYCINKLQGLNLPMIFIKDIGLQFGRISTRNAQLVSDSLLFICEKFIQFINSYSSNNNRNYEDNIYDYILRRIFNIEKYEKMENSIRTLQQYTKKYILFKKIILSVNSILFIELLLCILGGLVCIVSLLLTLSQNSRVQRYQIVFLSTSTIIQTITLLLSITINLFIIIYCRKLGNLTYFDNSNTTNKNDTEIFNVSMDTGFYINICRTLFQVMVLAIHLIMPTCTNITISNTITKKDVEDCDNEELMSKKGHSSSPFLNENNI
ncbi:Sma2p SCDLUD_004335 [Saccharomycodes ludwigii]|uniref:Sma2p n=1 Tax=Saccharomycodes ludwigii TaxID=36035 RepID=UPI001E8AE3EF|nr:hypothetical protein SCDLUD_004335 [Saccharomycodes ludwigii]KAH3900018.1 hypothetical protein SCDLUD_004335 [Saccharomycodes ludwigii]